MSFPFNLRNLRVNLTKRLSHQNQNLVVWSTWATCPTRATPTTPCSSWPSPTGRSRTTSSWEWRARYCREPWAGLEGGITGKKLHLQLGMCGLCALAQVWKWPRVCLGQGFPSELPVRCPWNMSCFKNRKNGFQHGGLITGVCRFLHGALGLFS